MMFVPCAQRVLWGSSDWVVIPKRELKHWKAQFGRVEFDASSGDSVRVQIASLKTDWEPLRCNEMVESSTPFAEGPQTDQEHGQDNTRTWGLFAGPNLVYKSVRKRGRVRTVLSWYGMGQYDPANPYISKRERAKVTYDPQYPEIELM
jgi:hypothetical protein